MKFLASLFISFIFMSTAFAQVINSEFKPSQEISNIKEGDILEATIRVWPIENADLSQFKKLEKQLFFNAFYLAQITSLAASPNNADVVELKGMFVVKSAKPQTIFNIPYNATFIELRLGEVKVSGLADKAEKFYILDQPLNSSRILQILAALLVLVLILVFIKRKEVKEFIIRMKPDPIKKKRKKYDELFRLANKREDFERLYREKDLWLSILVDKAPAHNEFLKVLNQHQYKKEWRNEEYSDVRSSFDIIRRSFEK